MMMTRLPVYFILGTLSICCILSGVYGHISNPPSGLPVYRNGHLLSLFLSLVALRYYILASTDILGGGSDAYLAFSCVHT